MQFPCSKNTLASLGITRPYNLLYTSENVSFKILRVKGQDNLRNKTVTIKWYA